MYIKLLINKLILTIRLELVALRGSKPYSYLFRTQKVCDGDVCCLRGV